MVRAVLLRVCVLAGVLGAVSCSEQGPTSPPGDVDGSLLTVELFSGTLPLRGVTFYSFSVEKGGTTFLTLLDVRENGEPSEALITIGLGVPRGTSCVSTNVLSVKAGGTPQVTGTTNRGVHCAVVFDPGNLTSAATFALNITRPK